MADYEIGISGLQAAQRALEVIGNNIANAATEGYHRQRIEFSPAPPIREGELLFGKGVDIDGVTRLIDQLLDREINRQNSCLEQVERELATLKTVENALGELSAVQSGLNAAIDKFFRSLQELSAHPGEEIWQNQAVSDAEAMAGRFRTMGEFLTNLDTQLQLETQNSVATINALTVEIAQLNDKIKQVEIGAGPANSLRDKRDQLIAEVAALASVDTQARPYGVVDVIVAGIPVVMGTATMELEAGITAGGKMGISAKDANNYVTNISGGAVGGLLTLKNSLVSDIRTRLDLLAAAIVQNINKYHVQGVASSGSFASLAGRSMSSENLADYGSNAVDGNIYIRVTNTSTGTVTRNVIAVDASTDTLSSIAADISTITGLNAAVVDSKLSISADADYKFDFLPAVLPSPTASTLSGSAPTISVSGICDGSSNDTLTFTVSGTGSVGNGALQLIVSDGSSNTIAALNVGAGYAAGEAIEVGNGIKIALGTGNLNDSETFAVDVFADTDTSGLLAEIGMNTFFFGTGAEDMAVSSAISASPSLIATSIGPDMSDNANILKLAEVKNEAIDSLGSVNCGEYYRQLVTDVGLKIAMREVKEDNSKQIVNNLESRRNDISGVDINEEAAELLVYERMFQAMAKYIATVQSSMSSLMEIV
ncbi:MAG: flagellar hook-associated protein FlgK [Planctomycetota bacterium]|jgi:flagellar hook-associated protein FlgK